MSQAESLPPPADTPASPPAEDVPVAPDPLIEQHEPWNFCVLALYATLLRVGWIFKTESIIMPAVLDSIAGAAWLRGCLPILNRAGQSIPQILYSRRLKVMPRKRWSLMSSTMGMSLSFLILAAIWWTADDHVYWWMPAAFMTFYGLSFVATGLNQLALGTLQGKLVRPTRRGRLLAWSDAIGPISAIIAAWLLLSIWLTPTHAAFDRIFGFTGLCFGLSALGTLLLWEPADNYHQPATSALDSFAAAWKVIHSDANFRRVALVAMLFGTSLMLFPHYQALGRERLGLTMDNLTWWVILQNSGTALFSMLAGPVADRRGNRLVLQFTLLGIACLPAVAIAAAHAGPRGPSMFPWIFFLVGLTPVSMKVFNNYVLEISATSEHPRYLSTVNLCLAGPIFFSPLVGLVVDLTNFETVFFFIGILLVTAWGLSFTLIEPRHRLPS